MRKWLKTDFNFSKRELNGLLVLIFILAVITVIPDVYELLYPEQPDLLLERKAIQSLMRLNSPKDEYPAYPYKRKAQWNLNRRVFNFDPNHTSQAEWQLLGLTARQAAVMIRYTEKGGRFYRKEDLRKMYPISPERYQALAPYVQISAAARLLSGSTYMRKPYAKPPQVMVSLNTADTVALDAIKGVGAAFARRIFKYRERLGGFYKKEQLMEVFGLDSAKYREIKDQVSIDEEAVKKISINKAEFADLRYHPYLNYKQVNAILQFRKQHGNYSNIADLKKVAIFSPADVERLEPYFSF